MTQCSLQGQDVYSSIHFCNITYKMALVHDHSIIPIVMEGIIYVGCLADLTDFVMQDKYFSIVAFT